MRDLRKAGTPPSDFVVGAQAIPRRWAARSGVLKTEHKLQHEADGTWGLVRAPNEL